ncbi:MAG: PH domain-containing protein [Oscillospiraceae bacterium]|nr:PH domain-containing protein [Oscillospiraceae bacterium]
MQNNQENITPNNSTKNFKRVHKNAIKQWVTTRIIFLIVMAAALLLFMFIMSSDASVTSETLTILWIVSASLCFLQIVNIVVYPILEYLQWSYLIEGDRIEIKKGIIFKDHMLIPISRIQHVAFGQGPLQRVFGIANVDIYTAGGEFTIVNVAKTDAEEICDKLQSYVTRNSELKAAADEVLLAKLRSDTDTPKNVEVSVTEADL